MWLVLTISLFYRWRPTYLLLFSHSVVSDSSWPHELQHARLPCPSPSPRVCSDSCPLNQWCHPIISSSVICFSCLQSSLASGSFPTSRLLPSGSQSIGASASVLPMNVQDWFPLELTGLISLQSKGPSRVFSSTSLKASMLWCSAFFMVQLPRLCMTSWKSIAFTTRIFVSKVRSLL